MKKNKPANFLNRITDHQFYQTVTSFPTWGRSTLNTVSTNNLHIFNPYILAITSLSVMKIDHNLELLKEMSRRIFEEFVTEEWNILVSIRKRKSHITNITYNLATCFQQKAFLAINHKLLVFLYFKCTQNHLSQKTVTSSVRCRRTSFTLLVKILPNSKAQNNNCYCLLTHLETPYYPWIVTSCYLGNVSGTGLIYPELCLSGDVASSELSRPLWICSRRVTWWCHQRGQGQASLTHAWKVISLVNHCQSVDMLLGVSSRN